MDLGLYNLKYPARKLIGGVLPLLRGVNPNAISWAMLPVGAATAAAYAFAPERPALYLVGIGLLLLRMFLGTLDGLVAVHFGKGTPKGELVNRLAPELCDAMYLGAMAVARPEWRLLGIGALVIAWLTSFSGLLGATIGKPTQSIGPAGPTDRLAALQVLSLAAYLGHCCGWKVDFMRVFLGWTIAGGTLTVILRLWRNLRSAAT
jgi:CDP-diacylglycerol--glycerol-3-phosphate 3-phosphatidyltransferase